MPEENKVQFNLCNVHYALLKSDDGDKPVYGTPVKVPGAVSLAMDASGETTSFYADGIRYYAGVSNTGYEGDLEMARFPDQMLQDIWRIVKDETAGVLVENSGLNPAQFALLFQIDGDKQSRRAVLYNCVGERPEIGGETTEESKEPKTEKSSITASPLSNGNIRAFTDATVSTEVYDGWFDSVYLPSAATQAKIDQMRAGLESDTETTGN